MNLKNNLICVLLTIFLFCLMSTASAEIVENDLVNITYVGFNETDSFSIEALMADYLGEKDYLNSYSEGVIKQKNQKYNVNYRYINGYESAFEGSELQAFSAPGGDIESQDIVIFDMFWVYNSEELLNNLKAAKSANSNLKLVQIRSSEADSDGIFDVQEEDDGELTELITQSFYTYDFLNATDSSSVMYRTQWIEETYWGLSKDDYYKKHLLPFLMTHEAEGASLSVLIISHLLKEYALPEKIEGMNFDKTRVLYVGYDAGQTPQNYSGIIYYDTVKSAFDNSVYSGYAEIETVVYGVLPDGRSDVRIVMKEDLSWCSPEILKANMGEKGLQFEDFDIIIFDGLFTDDALLLFEDIFHEASEAGNTLVFNTGLSAENYLTAEEALPFGGAIGNFRSDKFPEGSIQSPGLYFDEDQVNPHIALHLKTVLYLF